MVLDPGNRFSKRITILSLRYQKKLNYIAITWTVTVSFFIGMISYGLVSWNILKDNVEELIIFVTILLFIEIACIAVLMWLYSENKEIMKEIKSL